MCQLYFQFFPKTFILNLSSLWQPLSILKSLTSTDGIKLHNGFGQVHSVLQMPEFYTGDKRSHAAHIQGFEKRIKRNSFRTILEIYFHKSQQDDDPKNLVA